MQLTIKLRDINEDREVKQNGNSKLLSLATKAFMGKNRLEFFLFLGDLDSGKYNYCGNDYICYSPFHSEMVVKKEGRNKMNIYEATNALKTEDIDKALSFLQNAVCRCDNKIMVWIIPDLIDAFNSANAKTFETQISIMQIIEIIASSCIRYLENEVKRIDEFLKLEKRKKDKDVL